MKKQALAIFDFDGTITKRDTLFLFLIKSYGVKKFLLNIFFKSPILILFKLGLIGNSLAKQELLKSFIKGMDVSFFEKKCRDFAQEIENNLHLSALERVRWHKEKGHRIIILSASPENWITPWASMHGIEDVIATKLEVVNNSLTGNFSTKNCYGEEKFNRLINMYNISDYYTYAYGDSESDLSIISRVNEGYYKNFSKRYKN